MAMSDLDRKRRWRQKQKGLRATMRAASPEVQAAMMRETRTAGTRKLTQDEYDFMKKFIPQQLEESIKNGGYIPPDAVLEEMKRKEEEARRQKAEEARRQKAEEAQRLRAQQQQQQQQQQAQQQRAQQQANNARNTGPTNAGATNAGATNTTPATTTTSTPRAGLPSRITTEKNTDEQKAVVDRVLSNMGNNARPAVGEAKAKAQGDPEIFRQILKDKGATDAQINELIVALGEPAP